MCYFKIWSILAWVAGRGFADEYDSSEVECAMDRLWRQQHNSKVRLGEDREKAQLNEDAN
jgi:hypothetical protein